MATDRATDVPDPDHPRIVADDTFGGEPRIRGRRITVLDVYDRVRDGDGTSTPMEFADTSDVAVADVYAALAYYHAHEGEMERHRESKERASREVRTTVREDRPDGVSPTA